MLDRSARLTRLLTCTESFLRLLLSASSAVCMGGHFLGRSRFQFVSHLSIVAVTSSRMSALMATSLDSIVLFVLVGELGESQQAWCCWRRHSQVG
jgi:hypothetical protein